MPQEAAGHYACRNSVMLQEPEDKTLSLSCSLLTRLNTGPAGKGKYLKRSDPLLPSSQKGSIQS